VIGLDTNVLIRYLAQDEPRQSAIATRLIERELTPQNTGFISLVVLVELYWVLKRLYAATDEELLETVADLLGSAHFQIESRAMVHAVVQRVKSLKSETGKPGKAGLTDHLIVEIAKTQGCSHTVSFDKAAVRSAGMQLLV
jgi:predicted nucleic-acid-binding protein